MDFTAIATPPVAGELPAHCCGRAVAVAACRTYNTSNTGLLLHRWRAADTSSTLVGDAEVNTAESVCAVPFLWQASERGV